MFTITVHFNSLHFTRFTENYNRISSHTKNKINEKKWMYVSECTVNRGIRPQPQNNDVFKYYSDNLFWSRQFRFPLMFVPKKLFNNNNYYCVWLLRGNTQFNDDEESRRVESSVVCEWHSLWLVYDVYHAWLVSFYVLRSFHFSVR